MTTIQASPAERRAAQIAQVLSRAVRHEEADAVDVLRILRHELRRLNTNRKLRIPTRSVGAQAVIDRYGAAGVPKNGSPDALHADHVHPLTEEVLRRTKGVEAWLRELRHLRAVVCVTAAENYALERVERSGVTGPEKYAAAGIAFVVTDEESPVGTVADPALLLAA
jgi:hypothetical protein